MKPPKKNKRTTIVDVAKNAGVSVSAVSKVLCNAYGVSDNLRAKVETSIQTLNYRPRAAARGMRGKTFTIGLIICMVDNSLMTDIISGIREISNAMKYRLMVAVGEIKKAIDIDLIESMVDHQMDGIILVAPGLPTEIIEKYAKETPIVCIAYHPQQTLNFDTVNVDDYQGAQMAVQHLIDQGMKKITMFSLINTPNYETSPQKRREIGYRDLMEKSGLGEFTQVQEHDLKDNLGLSETRTLLNSDKRPDAIFCWSDLDATILLSLAHEEGLKVPEDIAIIGFDNNSVANLSQINLSSIDQQGEEMGKTSAKMLLERLNDREETCHEIIEPKLVIRKSSMK